MSSYRPNEPFVTPVRLLVPTYQTIKGVKKKVYPATGDLIFCSFKTYGGTEKDVNGIYSIEDTAIIETWYRPDIESACGIMLADTGTIYEIINEPEDINMRHQFLKFKVRRYKGGA